MADRGIPFQMLGRGERVMVLAQGFGLESGVWWRQVAALEDRCRLLLFDLPGCGRSDAATDRRPGRYVSLEAYAEDLLWLLDEAGVDRAIAVGHSVGAMIAMLAAAAEPARFDRLVLLDGSPRFLDDPATGYEGGSGPADVAAMLAAMGADYQRWAGSFSPWAAGRQAMGASASPGIAEAAVEYEMGLRRLRPEVALGMVRMIFAADIRAVVQHLRVPVTLVQSLADPVVPASVGRYLARAIPDCTLHELDVAGHLPQVAAPDAVNAILADQLRPPG